ncbi:PD-(D/E)XK nuclease-like domain-containing protein, partial [Secundilactobacillus paracollinoides]
MTTSISPTKNNKVSSKPLTKSNYYDRWTDDIYLSPTVYKRYQACEAEALAEQAGQWAQMDATALLVGNYLHSYFESPAAHEAFIEEHKDELKSSRKPYKLLKPYQQAEMMIKTLDEDETFQQFYQGDKEVIVTGKIEGVPWKGKIDCLNLDNNYFIDLKTTRDLHMKYWDTDEHKYVPFVTKYNYQLQMAVYRELIKQTFGIDCTPYIVGVTKQDPPDKAVLSIPDEQLGWALDDVKAGQQHILDVMHGNVEPTRCEQCDYCRSTKTLGD